MSRVLNEKKKKFKSNGDIFDNLQNNNIGCKSNKLFLKI